MAVNREYVALRATTKTGVSRQSLRDCNRVKPSHGQEAFASASAAFPQLAYRLAAPPRTRKPPSRYTKAHKISRINELLPQKGFFRVVSCRALGPLSCPADGAPRRGGGGGATGEASPQAMSRRHCRMLPQGNATFAYFGIKQKHTELLPCASCISLVDEINRRSCGRSFGTLPRGRRSCETPERRRVPRNSARATLFSRASRTRS